MDSEWDPEGWKCRSKPCLIWRSRVDFLLIDWLGKNCCLLVGGGYTYGLDEIIEMDSLTQQMLFFFQNHLGDFHDDALVSAVKKHILAWALL